MAKEIKIAPELLEVLKSAPHVEVVYFNKEGEWSFSEFSKEKGFSKAVSVTDILKDPS